jgi:hypothetical protein
MLRPHQWPRPLRPIPPAPRCCGLVERVDTLTKRRQSEASMPGRSTMNHPGPMARGHSLTDDGTPARPASPTSGQTEATLGIPFSRFEIAELIGDLFDAGPVPRIQILDTARRRGARRCLLGMLGRLPDRAISDLHDLWTQLPDIPDIYDPWEQGW